MKKVRYDDEVVTYHDIVFIKQFFNFINPFEKSSFRKKVILPIFFTIIGTAGGFSTAWAINLIGAPLLIPVYPI